MIDSYLSYISELSRQKKNEVIKKVAVFKRTCSNFYMSWWYVCLISGNSKFSIEKKNVFLYENFFFKIIRYWKNFYYENFNGKKKHWKYFFFVSELIDLLTEKNYKKNFMGKNFSKNFLFIDFFIKKNLFYI